MAGPVFGSDEWQVEYYRHEFAYLLRAVRKRAGKTVRDIAADSNYTHPHIARSLTGARFPSWKLVQAVLDACGVGGDRLRCWLRLWKTANATQARTPPSSVDEPGRRTWAEIQQEWEARTAAIRQPDATLVQIQQTVTLEQLGRVLTALTTRQGPWSLRQLEQLSGISRSTLHGWYAGQRKPSAARLQQLVVALDTTRAEQIALTQCLTRISPARRPPEPERPGACAVSDPSSGRLCTLSRSHRGPHQAAVGQPWFDEGELDGGRDGLTLNTYDDARPAQRVHFGPGW